MTSYASEQPIEFTPFKSVADIAFGTTRTRVRDLLGPPGASFRRGAGSHLSDHYPEKGLIFGYLDGDLLDEVEMHIPARPVLAGVELLTRSARDVIQQMAAASLDVNWVDGTCHVPSWGIALWASYGRESDPFDSLTAFSGPLLSPPTLFEDVGTIDSAALLTAGRECLGPLRLGASRADVRRLLGPGASMPTSDGDVDRYFETNVEVTYDRQLHARRIAATAPGTGVNIGSICVGSRYRDCLSELTSRSIEFVEREAEIYLPAYGLRLTVSRSDDPALPISAVIITADDHRD